MSEESSKKLQEKRKELEEELKKIEYMLDDSINQVRSDVSSFDPRGYIRRKPLSTVGISILIGFLLGKERDKNESTATRSESDDNRLTSTIWYEIKRLAMRKAVAKVGDYIEDFFDEL
ncbi:MAG TPA: hypothetical protein VE868_12610 [Balneolaceae bacterium]|nr:hypothetical protein [Balneolaceae bacterium]